MKKLLILTIAASTVFFSHAQEDGDGKKLKGGLTLGTGLNFNNPETNLIAETGAGLDFVIGMLADYQLSDNIAITSGLEFDFTRFSYTFANSFQNGGPLFVEYSDKELLRNDHEGASDGIFRVDERRTRAIYATIPTMIKFQTNYMGYVRYFGRFGLRNSFLMRSRGDFEGAFINQALEFEEGELDDMRMPRDMSFYKGAAGLSLGAEWNFAGSTALVGEIGYYYGFTDVHRTGTLFGDDDKNYSMFQFNQSLERNYRTASSLPGQLLLKISVLF